jgi:hypothetical protein
MVKIRGGICATPGEQCLLLAQPSVWDGEQFEVASCEQRLPQERDRSVAESCVLHIDPIGTGASPNRSRAIGRYISPTRCATKARRVRRRRWRTDC